MVHFILSHLQINIIIYSSIIYTVIVINHLHLIYIIIYIFIYKRFIYYNNNIILIIYTWDFCEWKNIQCKLPCKLSLHSFPKLHYVYDYKIIWWSKSIFVGEKWLTLLHWLLGTHYIINPSVRMRSEGYSSCRVGMYVYVCMYVCVCTCVCMCDHS